MKTIKIFLGLVFLLSHFVVKGQEDFLMSIFESIKSDDPTAFYKLYILDDKTIKELAGSEMINEKGLNQYRKDRHAVFYEIIRKIDDHTKIVVDSIQGLDSQRPVLRPKIFFSTEERNCNCQFTITKHKKRKWIVLRLEPRVRCEKKKDLE